MPPYPLVFRREIEPGKQPSMPIKTVRESGFSDEDPAALRVACFCREYTLDPALGEPIATKGVRDDIARTNFWCIRNGRSPAYSAFLKAPMPDKKINPETVIENLLLLTEDRPTQWLLLSLLEQRFLKATATCESRFKSNSLTLDRCDDNSKELVASARLETGYYVYNSALGVTVVDVELQYGCRLNNVRGQAVNIQDLPDVVRLTYFHLRPSSQEYGLVLMSDLQGSGVPSAAQKKLYVQQNENRDIEYCIQDVGNIYRGMIKAGELDDGVDGYFSKIDNQDVTTFNVFKSKILNIIAERGQIQLSVTVSAESYTVICRPSLLGLFLISRQSHLLGARIEKANATELPIIREMTSLGIPLSAQEATQRFEHSPQWASACCDAHKVVEERYVWALRKAVDSIQTNPSSASLTEFYEQIRLYRFARAIVDRTREFLSTRCDKRLDSEDQGTAYKLFRENFGQAELEDQLSIIRSYLNTRPSSAWFWQAQQLPLTAGGGQRSLQRDFLLHLCGETSIRAVLLPEEKDDLSDLSEAGWITCRERLLARIKTIAEMDQPEYLPTLTGYQKRTFDGLLNAF